MKERILWATPLLILCLITLVITIFLGKPDLAIAQWFKLPERPNSGSVVETGNFDWGIPATCALKPEANQALRRSSTPISPRQITLDHFRRNASNFNVSQGQPVNSRNSTTTWTNYTPRESIALAHPTNYGQRYVLDLYSRPANHEPIVVLHETVFSASSAINTFKTPHYNDDDQVSYHTLIRLNGDIIYVVPPDQRAFGAGDSVFKGNNGIETVKTHPDYPPSVNNFAYHISLETPVDGRDNGSTHGGYTLAQYQALAWLVAKTGVPDSRITTHKAVDRSGSRIDPRSFNTTAFLRFLRSFPRTQDIIIGCQAPLGDR
jgi:hypothetical protein